MFHIAQKPFIGWVFKAACMLCVIGILLDLLNNMNAVC